MTDPINVITAAMKASGSVTVGDLVDYCREHGTTPQALADAPAPRTPAPSPPGADRSAPHG